MRIQQITLHNMRLVEDMSVRFDASKNVTIVLGENGKGKTTLLDAIALSANVFTSAFPLQKRRNPSPWDIRIGEGNKAEDYLSIQAVFSVNGTDIKTERFLRRDALVKASPDFGEKELREYALSLMEKIQEGRQVELPMVIYYSTERGRIQAPKRNRNFQKIFERWDSYTNATEADTDFRRFFEWFDYQEDQERRSKIEKNDRDYQLPVLKAVRNALHQILDCRYKNPRIELSPMRFVMDEQTEEGSREVRIEQMSDGYRIMVAMVADIASRLAEANPNDDNPLEGKGIVLIDEADLHLHPAWQRKILHDLSDVFGNIQFIVTTHSPLIAMGAADIAQILVFDERGKLHEAEAGVYSTYDVGQVLMSDLFNLPTDRAPQWDSMIKERHDLLERSKLSEADKKRLDELEAGLSGLSFGESAEEIKARKLIIDIANRLSNKQ